jgi:hypothetical protein
VAGLLDNQFCSTSILFISEKLICVLARLIAPLRQGVLHLQMNDKFYHAVKGVGHLSPLTAKELTMPVRQAWPVWGKK